jgi:GNAT superfamily N-acetyltransferase
MSTDAMSITIVPVVATDFEELADFRVAAMRDRERLRSTFSPEHTRFIVFEGARVGFYAARPSPEGLRLDHLYVHPTFQSRGIGGAVLKSILADADSLGVPVLVGALKESASNRFYQRHGFASDSEGEWDNYYVRPVSNNRRAG